MLMRIRDTAILVTGIQDDATSAEIESALLALRRRGSETLRERLAPLIGSMSETDDGVVLAVRLLAETAANDW